MESKDPIVRRIYTLPQSVVDLVDTYTPITKHRSKTGLVAAAIREYVKPYEKRRQRAVKLMRDRGMSESEVEKVLTLIDG